MARDLSEKIETSIVQHCESFAHGTGHSDLSRFGADWEVKIRGCFRFHALCEHQQEAR